MSFSGQTAAQIQAAFQSGKATAEQVLDDHLAAIKSRNEELNAFLEVDEQGARFAAAEVDRKRAAGEPLGRLAGLPIALKDNMCVKGWTTSCSSRMLESFRPPYQAHVIDRLLAEDAVLIGRTNLDEFAMGSSCENSAFGPTRNPWDSNVTPGGSSGGSAVAVAAGMAPLALGSDTGGSIRQPAGYCGVVGMKPTYGRVSRYGLVAFASSLDQIGPFAHTIEDAALLLSVIAGHDQRDSTSVDAPFPEVRDWDRPLEGLRVGIVPEHYGDGIDSEVSDAVHKAIDAYRSLGASISEVHLPHSKYCVAAYYIIAPSEASSNLARYDGVHYGHRAKSFSNMIDMFEASRGEGFGDEVKRRIMIGTYALSSGYYDAYYLKAQKVRKLIADDYRAAFESVDVVLSPTAPTAAFRIGELVNDPLQMYLNDIYTIGANLAGIPGVSVPCGFTSAGLPIGLQLFASAYNEETLLRAAHQYQQATEWHTRRPEPVSGR